MPEMMPGLPGMPEMPGRRQQPEAPPPVVDPNAAAPQEGVSTNFVMLVCRAVKLAGVDAPDSEIAYAVEKEIKNSPMVDPKATQLTGQITQDDATGTFVFTVHVVPLNPLTF